MRSPITVGELIDQLVKLDPNLPVSVADTDGDWMIPVTQDPNKLNTTCAFAYNGIAVIRADGYSSH